jgi:hypothetical protein
MCVVNPMKTFLFLLLAAATLATASIIEEGGGIVYGADHAFNLKAPKGWMLDNESAANQGVHAVFYPKGATWKDSKVVAYAQARPRKEGMKTAADAAAETIKKFRDGGSEKYDGKKVKTVKTESGKEGEIYHFTGDKWGNFEAVVYFVQEKTINFIVFNSREEKVFTDSLPAFEELAKSYTFLGEKVDIQKPAAPAKKPKKAAK